MDRRFEGRFQVNGISGIHQVPGKPPAGAVKPGEQWLARAMAVPGQWEIPNNGGTE